ncbi:thiol-disulfide oxidoreductase DCC family protein, partial [Aquibacillus kalidii]|uniref:thiol-disulfide oxidoreductase DCC family protein n=1 Tax=Aquibacillus kalidii TaxID=2762597 RepID=UPI001C996228
AEALPTESNCPERKSTLHSSFPAKYLHYVAFYLYYLIKSNKVYVKIISEVVNVMGKPVILYDQYCYLCQQTKRIITALDWLNRLKWESLQKYSKDHTVTEQEKKMMEGEIHIKRENKEDLKGFYAVRFILLRCPLTTIIGALSYVPKAEIIGVPIYRWIARNRYRLFKDKCENGSCQIPR